MVKDKEIVSVAKELKRVAEITRTELLKQAARDREADREELNINMKKAIEVVAADLIAANKVQAIKTASDLAIVVSAAEKALRVLEEAKIEQLKVIGNTNTGDHDILTTLVANVGFISASQDKFHTEMKQSFVDLQNNYTGNIAKNTSDITYIEINKVNKKDFELLEDKVSMIENWKSWVI